MIIKTYGLTALLTLSLSLAMVGCSGSSDESTDDSSSSAAPATPELSDTFFADQRPADAVPLIDAKSAAAVGDTVTFEARIGGSREPFTGRAAIFTVVDSSLKSCDQIPGDTCKYPWDYCCEPKGNLTLHMATVQVVDGEGNLIKGSMKDMHGLTGGATVVVSGTVRDKNDDGVFLIDATSIYVTSSMP